LFVVEMARLYQDDFANLDFATLDFGDPTRNPILHQQTTTPLDRLPKSVLAVIDARLARLSKQARTLAEVAATIGRSFAMPVLSAAAALNENELVDALDELWRRR